jgi:hypothetical protein
LRHSRRSAARLALVNMRRCLAARTPGILVFFASDGGGRRHGSHERDVLRDGRVAGALLVGVISA